MTADAHGYEVAGRVVAAFASAIDVMRIELIAVAALGVPALDYAPDSAGTITTGSPDGISTWQRGHGTKVWASCRRHASVTGSQCSRTSSAPTRSLSTRWTVACSPDGRLSASSGSAPEP